MPDFLSVVKMSCFTKDGDCLLGHSNKCCVESTHSSVIELIQVVATGNDAVQMSMVKNMPPL